MVVVVASIPVVSDIAALSSGNGMLVVAVVVMVADVVVDFVVVVAVE